VVNPGDPVTFSVGAFGAAPLHFQWRLNQVELPDETNSVLSIGFCDIPNGGTYDVVVTNQIGFATSQPGFLQFNPGVVPQVPPSDAFSTASPLGGSPSGLVQSSNAGATLEPGEPRHAGKVGGASVWFTWMAPYSGWATFTTAGSTFDTLLGVYLGSTVSALSAIAGDDDSAGFFTSQVRFYAMGGTTYQIAVDGYNGAQGLLLLGWNLESQPIPPPVIFAQPADTTAALGGTASFCVQASGPALAYQWFYEGIPIFGATNPVFRITNAQPTDVGFYSVSVADLLNNVTNDSLTVELQLGSDIFLRAQRKLEDLGYGCGIPSNRCHSSRDVGPSCFSSVSGGVPGYQTFQNTNAVTLKPPCQTITSSALWLGLNPLQDGLLTVDTSGSVNCDGSLMDTWITVFRDSTNPSPANLVFVACNDDISATNRNSLLQVPAKAGTNYTIMINGLRDSCGTISVHWLLDVAPTISWPLSAQSVTGRLGAPLTLYAGVTNGAPKPSYRWLRNQVTLPGQTGAQLVFQSLSTNDAASYSAIATNIVGGITNAAAAVTVETPVRLTFGWQSASNVTRFHLQGTALLGWVIQATTDLNGPAWVPLYTNRLPGGFVNLDFADVVYSNAWLYPRQFYRAVQWP
jgi:hypothetical protein